MTAKTFLQGLSRLSFLSFQVGDGVGGRVDGGQGTLVALMTAESQGLALLGSGGRASPPQYARTALPAQAGHFSNKGWRGGDCGPVGSRAGAAPG